MMPESIDNQPTLESDLALSSLYSIEYSLSYQGLVLAHPTHPVISVLQHLSKKPWVQFDLNWSNVVEHFQTEWKYLTNECVGERLQFYVDLKESVAQQRNGRENGFSILRKYIKKEFTCYFCTNKDDTITVTQAFSLTPSGEIVPITIETSFNISDWKEDNVFLCFEQNEPNKPFRTRLVTKYELLYPNFIQLGEKLIDQIDQFHLISKASNNISIGDLSTVVSSTEYFDELNSLIREVERSQTFHEILNYVLPSSTMELKILRKLMELEPQLSTEEKLDLRIKLIQLTTTELFYPLRKIVLIEKEKQETIAEESSEMQRHMQKEGEYLASVIAATEVKLKEAEDSISRAREDIDNIQKSMNDVDTEKEELVKKNLLAQLQEMKEKMAFSKFVLDLPNHLRPEKTVQNLKLISELDKSTTLSVLMQRIFHIFEISEKIEKCPYLQGRITRDLHSDKEDVFRVLEEMKQQTHIDIDVEGDLIVQGGNVIFSSILPQITSSIEKNENIQQVKICCHGNLVLDVSLQSKHFSGRNVIIVANNIVSSEAKVTIDVSGKDGENHTNLKAKNGMNFGGNGEDGLPGEHGQHGGNIHLEAVTSIVNMDNIILNCKGGDGANGQHGGDGHCGRNGNNGDDGQVEDATWFCEYYAISEGKAGERGQSGGLGGLGGVNGEGGKGGISKIVSSPNATPIEKKHENGLAGNKGNDGKEGQNGRHGIKGKDHGRFARSILNGWEYKIGYNLKAVEIKGWVWEVAGYYLEEGAEPKVESVMSKTKEASKQKQATKQQQQQQIVQNTIHSMKQTVIEKKTGGNLSQQSEEEIIVNQQLNQVEQSINSKQIMASEKQRALTQKTAAFKQIEVARSSLSTQLGDLESRHESIKQATLSAKRDEENAEIRAKEMEQLSLQLREKHEEALDRCKVTQHQIQQETEKEQEYETMISKEGSAVQELEDEPKSKSIGFSRGLVSSLRTKMEKRTGYSEFIEFCTKNEVPFDVQVVLEYCWRQLENMDEGVKELISSLCVNHEWKYIKNYLTSDLLVAKKFGNYYSRQNNTMPLTLAEYIVKKRLGKERTVWQHKNNKELKTFLDSMEVESIAELKLYIWHNTPTKEESPLANVSEKKLKTYKENVITTAKQLFLNMLRFLGKPVDEFPHLLDKLIKFTEEKAEQQNPQQFLSTFLKEHESLSASSLEKQIFSIFPSTAVSELGGMLEAELRVKTIMGKSQDPKTVLIFVHFALSNVHYTKEELNNTAKLLGVLKKQELFMSNVEVWNLLNGVAELLDRIYDKDFAEVKKNIRDECRKYKVISLEVLYRIETLLDSPYLSVSFVEREKCYAKLKENISLSTSSIAQWLSTVYTSSHGKYVVEGVEGTFDFSKFLEYLQKHLLKFNTKKEKINQLKLHLQVGKLNKHNIEPFSKNELAEIENTLWTCLNESNQNIVHEMAMLVCKAESLRLDYTNVKEKCDVVSFIEKVKQLKVHWNQFIPCGKDESSVTDSGRLKIHLDFLLTHVQFLVMEEGNLSTQTKLETALSSADVTNIDQAIQKLEQFSLQNFPCRESHSSFPEYVEKWLSIPVTDKTDFQSAYRNGLHYVKFSLFSEAEEREANQNNSGTELLKKCELIKKKLTEGKRTLSSSVAKEDLDRFFNLIEFFIKPTIKTEQVIHHDLEQLCTNEYIRIRPVWIKVQNICDQAEKYFCDIAKDTSPPLYVLANFAASIQSKVLDDLNLLNVEGENGKEVELHFNYPHHPDLQRQLVKGRDVDIKFPIGVNVLKKILVIHQYPFTDILFAMVQIYTPNKSKSPIQFYEVTSRYLKQGTSLPHAKLWIQLMENFNDINTKSAGMLKKHNVKVHLACLLVQLDFDHKLRLLLSRLLQNLTNTELGKTLVFTEMPKLSPETTRQQLLALFQKIPKHKLLEEVFLLPNEIIWYQSLCNVVGYNSTEINSKFFRIIVKYDPISWCSRFEQLYFNQTFRLFSTPSSKTLDMKDSMRDTVFLLKLTDRGKKMLRAIQQTKTYEEFKLTYLLQEQRVLYLDIMNKIVSALLSTDVQVLESAKDCKMFLTLIRDIDVNTLSFVANNKFPQNWLKWILIKCISKDFMALHHTSKAIEECEQLEHILYQLLHKMDRENVQFLLTLHHRLKTETDVTACLVLEIVNGVKKSAFSLEEMRDVRNNFDIDIMSYWPRIIRIHRLTVLCIKQGYHIQVVEKLLGMDESFGETIVDTLMDILFLNNDKLKQDEKMSCLQKYCSTEWILDEESVRLLAGKDFIQIKQDVEKYSKEKRKEELQLDGILHRMKFNPINKKVHSHLISELKGRIVLIQQFAEENYNIKSQMKNKPAFGELMKEFISKWSKIVKATDYKQLDEKGICNTLALISRAVQYHYKYAPRVTQLVSVLMLINGLIRNKPAGKIGEIETGEGKSVIVSMFASFCSLFNARVHVITSNKLLAQDNAKEASGFFEILGLTVTNNCDKDSMGESAREARYNNNVVYGDLGSFQADKLQTDFFSKKIMEHSPNVTIVDEVDSLLLDKGANMLYLSHSIPELKYLRPIFLLIWRTVNAHRISHERKQKNPTKPYTDSDVHLVRRAVEIKMKNSANNIEIEYPECLQNFIIRRLGVWVRQAFIARFMPVNEDFIVEEGQHRILTMDNDTGVEQGNMHLSLGLHQFLQLKHQTKLSPESLKCVFMSNHCYFEKHAGTVFGITGTLGGDEEMNLLFHFYGVEFFAMPRYKLNKRIEEETLVLDSQDKWMATILDSVKCHKVKQPILIIAENIANHKRIQTALRGERIVEETELIDYSSSERHTDLIKKISDEDGLKKGSVVLSTNLGGRGTDLKIHEEAKVLGMHVILTFLPPNLRVEKQAFGRTARAGENGTVQFILWTKQKQKRMNSSKENGQKQKSEDIASIYYLKEERKRREIKRLKIIQDRDISKIKIQDDLFLAYSNFRKEEIEQSIIFMQHKKRIRNLQLAFLDNRWAVWLDSIRELLDHLHLGKELQHQNIWNEFEIFKKEMMARMDNKNVKMFADFTSEFVKIGTTYERIAMKWLISSIISGDYSEAENIFGEWKENLHSLWKGTKGTKATYNAGKSLFTKLDPTAVEKVIGQLSEKLNAEKPPTDLELGLKILKLASESEQKFSHPASVYKGMLLLQQNSTDKFNAKKALLEAKDRIHSRIEFNYSSLSMLDDACKEMEKNEENVNIGPNKFREQIINENNLLHIHLDAIQSTFHSPITEKFLKTQLPDVDSDYGAKKLLEFLLQEKWNLMKDCRVSKQVCVDDGILTMKEKELSNLVIPCLQSLLANAIKKSKSEPRVIRPMHFEDIVITRDQFLKELREKGMVENDNVSSVYIIKENKVQDANAQTFPDSLKKYEEIIIPRLKHSIDEVYRPEKILEELRPTENELQELLQTLIQSEWVEKTELFIKPTAELNYLILSEENPEYLEYLVDDTKAFRSSDLYQLYKNLVIRKGIPQPIPTDCAEFIDIDSLPFPTKKDVGAQDIFNALRSHGAIKDPRVKFEDIYAEPEAVEKRLKEIQELSADANFVDELKKLFANELNVKDVFDKLKLLVLKGIPQSIPSDCQEFNDIASLPFPTKENLGAQDIFNALRGHGAIKNPDIDAQAPEAVKERLKEIQKLFSNAKFLIELKKLLEIELQEKENAFVKFKQRLFELLKDSVGTLKKHPKIRVNYECISTKVPLESDSSSEELQECLREGVFDRIIVLDEYVTIWDNKGAWVVLIAGAAEIALGVTLEIFSFGTLSPLAQFLISEGASDATYAFKQFYRGNRIDYNDYKAMKFESMKWSLSTCFIPGGALGGNLAVIGGKSLLKLITKRVAMEMGKAGLKALMYSFIEDNVEKGIKDNLLGIKLMLDNIFNSVETQYEINRFANKCDSLFAVCWEKNQAKDMLTKIVSNVVSDDHRKDTSYNLLLDKTFDDLKTTFFRGMANSLAKQVLPMSQSNIFGSNRELGGRCQTEISLLVINTIMGMNSQIEKKISKIQAMKEKLLYAQDSAVVQEKEEFKEWKSSLTAKLKESLRSQIVAETYKTLTNQTMKKSLHESIRSGYKRMMNAHEISEAKFWGELEDEERGESEKLSTKENYTLLEKKQFTLVKNARGRSIQEMEVEWIELKESLGDIEFLTDTYGNTFIALRSENSMKHHFVLSKKEAAFDNYLQWRNECGVLN